MELWIPVNNSRKQFAGVGRYNFCDFQDGIQYEFPYPVRSGQLDLPHISHIQYGNAPSFKRFTICTIYSSTGSNSSPVNSFL